LGEGAPKGFVSLAGKPMLAYSLEAAARAGLACVLVAPPDRVEEARAAVPSTVAVLGVVAGGDTRQRSVWLGLAAVPDGAEVVVCHDAARPFAGPALFRRVVEALRAGMRQGVAGVVPVVASADTVKRARDGRVLETLPRDELVLAQTPQAFDPRALREAHENAERIGLAATDDAMLLEAAGFVVAVVPGDLRRAEDQAHRVAFRA
jgi:2-C-methyl-D-erythritol 4-phosphate cytidylyltransferase